MRFHYKPAILVCMVTFISILFLKKGFQASSYQHTSVAQVAVKSDVKQMDDYISVCHNITVTPNECQELSAHEKEETLTFPLQYISGATGSGNDWIMWLTAISMYTWPREKRHAECEVYDRVKGPESRRMQYVTRSPCLFFKSHEPWWISKDVSALSVRSVLLLRHPYDAAFSEYKRQVVKKASKAEDWKASNDGLTLEKFVDEQTNTTNKDLLKSLKEGTRKWLKHAKYWLTSYSKPLHILIYNDVIEHTAREIENAQRFLGYQFNGVNFRRHCCVMADTLNPTLKRKSSSIDRYKDLIYNKESDLQKMTDSAVEQVQNLLSSKFPGSNYKINRG